MSRGGKKSSRPHLNNNGGPSSLLTDDGAENAFDEIGMTTLRSHITRQMVNLEMKRPAVMTERQNHLDNMCVFD